MEAPNFHGGADLSLPAAAAPGGALGGACHHAPWPAQPRPNPTSTAVRGAGGVAPPRYLSREEIMVIAGIPHEELRHTRAGQEGRQEGKAAVTLRQLNRRCGPLSETTTSQIQALPLDQLESLADALLDFQGPADLATWLTANG